jgi:biofilm PGA synthesis N-glycosyltransferase PgaC
MDLSNKNVVQSDSLIALITPLRDEENYIEAMIMSIVAQKIRPAIWLIVDDGSTDNTPTIVQEYCHRYAFIKMLRLPSRSERRAGGEGAIASALQILELSSYDFVARFDADLLFEDNYFVRLLHEFRRDPMLGIAGGGLYVERNSQMVGEQAPHYHVRGALKMYRRECFEQIGNLSTDIGWDTIDEVYAWSRGWKTRSFCDIQVIHRRPTGGVHQPMHIFRERGRAEYLTWSHPAFVFAKTAKIALTSASNAWSFLKGFLSGYVRGSARLQDPVFRRTRRSQQLSRILKAVIPGSIQHLFWKNMTSGLINPY